MSTSIVRPFLVLALTWAATPLTAADDTPLLRKRVGVIFDVAGAGPSAIHLASRPIGTYTTPLTYSIVDRESRLLSRGIVALGSQRDIDLPAKLRGLAFADLDSWLNGYRVRVSPPYAFLASRARNLRVNGFAGELYLYVPQECKWLAVRVICESPGEGAHVELRNSSGAVAASARGEIPQWERMRVTPAKDQRARVWAIRIGKHKGLQLDDVDLFVEGDLMPIVALKAPWAESIAAKLAADRDATKGGVDQ